MKYTISIVALALSIISCGNNNFETNNSSDTRDFATTDTLKDSTLDTIPGNGNSSTSEFSKSISSPPGSTGVIDSIGADTNHKH